MKWVNNDINWHSTGRYYKKLEWYSESVMIMLDIYVHTYIFHLGPKN